MGTCGTREKPAWLPRSGNRPDKKFPSRLYPRGSAPHNLDTFLMNAVESVNGTAPQKPAQGRASDGLADANNVLLLEPVWTRANDGMDPQGPWRGNCA